jgi:hypothetical protein
MICSSENLDRLRGARQRQLQFSPDRRLERYWPVRISAHGWDGAIKLWCCWLCKACDERLALIPGSHQGYAK